MRPVAKLYLVCTSAEKIGLWARFDNLLDVDFYIHGWTRMCPREMYQLAFSDTDKFIPIIKGEVQRRYNKIVANPKYYELCADEAAVELQKLKHILDHWNGIIV